jgi:hypothetical protein
MMKKIVMAALALMLLCSCGKSGANNAPPPYDPTIADVLMGSGAFEGSDMAPIDGFIVSLLYGIEESTISDCVGYMAANTSVSADELVVLLCTDEAAAIAAEDACKARIAAQLAVCESYAPAAVPRLEQALVSRRGNTVLLVVGDPDVIAEAMKNR